MILCRPDECRSAGRRLAALGADFQRIRRLKDFATFEPDDNRRAQRPLAFPCDLPAITPKQLRSAAKRLGIESRRSSGFGADGGWTWWTPEQWAERVAALQAHVARSVRAETRTDDVGISAGEAQPEAPAGRPSSRLHVGPAWIHTDGTLGQAILVRGIDMLAQFEAREAARGELTTPAVADAGVPASLVAPSAAAPALRTESAPVGKPQAESSKNEESLEKQGEFQRPADGPLPRDGYARRQERKRRQQERDQARKRVPRP